MKRAKLRIYICVAAAALFAACSHGGSRDHDHDHAHDHNHVPAHDHDHDHAHGESADAADGRKAGFGSEIVVEPEVAERFGIGVDTVAAGQFREVVRASGVALQASGENAVVSAPVAGMVRLASGIEPGRSVAAGTVVATIDASGVSGGDAAAAARAALEVTRDEYSRIKALYDEQLATIGELNAARAAYEQAVAAYSPRAEAGTAISPIAGTVTAITAASGAYVEAGAPIATVASDRNLTLRIDLPQKYFAQAAAFTDAVVELPYAAAPFAIADKGGRRIVGSAIPAAGAAAAFVPVYFTLPNDGSVLPGSAFTAYLLGSGRDNVITIPVSALVEQQGNFFVYEKVDDEGYMKRPVTLGGSDGRRVEITSGLRPGEVIVSKGATTVRLAESGAAIPEGHTHNH